MKLKLLFLSLLTGVSSVVTGQTETNQKQEIVAPLTVGEKLDAKVLPEVWYRGEPVTEFKKGQTYVMEFWASPEKVRRKRGFERRAPGYYHRAAMKQYADSTAITFFSVCINGETDKERLKMFLALPEYQSTHAIALDGFKGTVMSEWLRPSKIEYIPYSIVIRDGIVLWHGESDTLPDTTLEMAMVADFTFAGFKLKKKQRQERYAAFGKFCSVLNDDAKAGEPIESLISRLEAENKKQQGYSYMVLTIGELKFSYYMKHKNPKAALAVMQDLIDTYPKDMDLLKRVYKYLNSTEELKPESNSAIIDCLANLAEITDIRYAEASWREIASLKEKANDIPGAIAAYQKALDISDSNKRLKIIKSGGTPELAR